jgi:antitoxin ParD1/3/4
MGASLAALPKFAIHRILVLMSTMNISLPDALKDFVDEQVAHGGYGTSSEYVRELIRKDQGRLHLRNLLLEGASSKRGKPVGPEYFDALRRQATKRRKR